MRRPAEIISELISIKANLLDLLFVAILLALSINLISSSLPIVFSLSPYWTLILGLGIALIAVLYSSLRLINAHHKVEVFNGFLIYNKQLNELVEVPRYDYSEEICHYFQSAFSENEALKSWWDKEPLKDRFKFNNTEATIQDLKSADFVIEATEYFFLEKLSLHLSEYFNSEKYPQHKIKTFQRQDIPDLLLSNRFIELFSKPMEERFKFIQESENIGKKMDFSRTVYAHVGGAFFNKFELALPSRSRLKRLSKSSIAIDTERFRLITKVEFLGVSTFIDPSFHKYVLGIDRNNDINDLKITISLDIKFKLNAFLSVSGWHYFFWLDSFTEKFGKFFDQKTFFNEIAWEQSLTMLSCLDKRIQLLMKVDGD